MSFARSLAVVLLLCLPACRSSKPPQPPVPPPTPPARPQVLLEVDRMAGQPAVPDLARLTQIFAEAGIDVTVDEDQTDLPSAPAVGLADLHALMTTNRSLPAPAGAWRVHMLVVSRDADRPGTLGIMFDFGSNDANAMPREGFAVFADAHPTDNRNEELLLTAAHELAHCFNIHHTDWEGTSFHNAATIESYAMADTVLWRLSAASKRHLAGPDRRLFQPGAGGVAFGQITQEHASHHQPTPQEQYAIIQPLAAARELPERVIEAMASKRDGAAAAGWTLKLSAPKNRFAVGEPIHLDVVLTNEAQEARRVYADLAPGDGMLNVLIGKAGETLQQLFLPPVHRCARGAPAELAAGASSSATFQVFFGARGWTMTEAGRYSIQASMPVNAPDQPAAHVHAEALELTLEAPAETAVARQKCLDFDVGLFLMLGGASHLRQADATLDGLFRDPQLGTDQRAAIGMALARSRFAPTRRSAKDPTPAERADPAAAQRYLDAAKDAKINLNHAIRVQQAFVESLGNTGGATLDAARTQLRHLETRKK